MTCPDDTGVREVVNDEDELAEVRWVTLPEVGELMSGNYKLYEPMHAYLERAISKRSFAPPDVDSAQHRW